MRRGTPNTGHQLFSNQGRPRDRAEFVAALVSSGRECAALLETKADPRIVGLIEHAGEHYGKLVTLYRVKGLVPPATRAQRQQKRE